MRAITAPSWFEKSMRFEDTSRTESSQRARDIAFTALWSLPRSDIGNAG